MRRGISRHLFYLTGWEIIMIDLKEFAAAAMLSLPDGEAEHLARRADALAESFAELNSINTEGVEPLVSVLSLHNVLREDIAEKCMTRDEILATAPDQYDGFFQVPGTIAM